MSALKRSLDDTTADEGIKKIKADGTETAELMEIRCLIDNYEASVIIGKAGSNVKMVRLESGAFVSILKTDSPVSKERVMTVKGDEVNISKALELIVTLLLDASNSRKQTDPAGAGESEVQYAMKILIHKFLAGSIIGKGGTIIREIQDETKARLQLSNEPLPGSTEKTVTITGTADTVRACALRVLGQLATNPLRPNSSTTLYIPGGPVQQAYGGHGGHGGHGAPSPYGAPPPSFNPYGAPPPQQYSPYQQAPSYGAPPPISYQPQGGGAGGKTEKIVIPTVCAGTVIGKGGSIIRDIKTQSGTQITISDPEPTAPNDRVVAVTGSQQGIQQAIYLIRQRVESYQPPGASNGAPPY